MLEVSSSKPLASENKEFAFCVGLLVWVTSSMWFASYCIRAEFFTLRTQRVAAAGFPCHKKNKTYILKFRAEPN